MLVAEESGDLGRKTTRPPVRQPVVMWRTRTYQLSQDREDVLLRDEIHRSGSQEFLFEPVLPGNLTNGGGEVNKTLDIPGCLVYILASFEVS